MKTIRPETCVYCGGTENLTDEHAPPKLLFPEPRPSDLITVRACDPCNKAGSKDAEYFRLMLGFDQNTKNTLSVQALKPAVQRSFARPQAVGFKKAFLSSLAPDGNGFKLRIDVWRIHHIIKRTVQCLYLHETGLRIPDAYHVSAFSDLVFQQFDRDECLDFQDAFVIPLAQTMPKVVANKQFAYSVIHMPNSFTSAWGLLFYGSIAYVALTGPKTFHEQTPD